MEAKIYKCDGELETLIRKQGWIETTDARDKQKGKKEFRKSKNSRVLIRFDYINLVIYENSVGCNGIGGPRVSAEELQLLFWYLNSNTSDKEEISDGHFDLEKAKSCYETMSSLLGYAKEFGKSSRESKKFERLLNNYTSALVN